METAVIPTTTGRDSKLPETLATRLRGPLPGRMAQCRFEPELSYGRHYAPAPSGARHAATLALLYWKRGRWHLPLTLRPATMSAHGGQVSFPGGVIEPGESSGAAALRELHEELGIRPTQVRLLGRLSPLYLYVSNFQVTPWVGVADEAGSFKPNPREVEEVLEVPLEHLLDPQNHGLHRRQHRGIRFNVPHFAWGRHHIWGATSMMLGEMVELVQDTTTSRAA